MSTDRVNGVDIPVLKALVDTINTSVTAIQATLTSFGGRLDGHDAALVTLTSQLGSLSSALTTLSGTVSSQGTTLGTHTAQISDLTGALSALSGSLTTLQGTVSTLSGTVDAQGTSLSTLQQAVTQAQQNIAALQAQGLIQTAPLRFYISATGDDTNDGLTQATPKKTFSGIWAVLPLLRGRSILVDMLEGTYAWTSPPAGRFNDSTRSHITFEGGTTHSLLGTTAASAGTTASVLRTQSLAVDQLVGGYVVMTSGATSGCRRSIVGNTATDIRLTAPLVNANGDAVAPATGDTFTVLKPRVTIQMPAAQSADSTITLPDRLWLSNLVITAPSEGPVRVQVDNGVWYGVELGDNVTAVAGRRLCVGTCPREEWAENRVERFGAWNSMHPLTHEGWGIGRVSVGGVVVDTAPNGSFLGYLSARGQVQASGQGSSMNVLAGIVGSVYASGRHCQVSLGLMYITGTLSDAIKTNGDAEICCTGDININTAAATAYYGISIEGKSRFRAEANVTIYGFSTGAAVRAAGCGQVAINGVLSIAQYGAANPILVSHAASLSVGGHVFVTNTSAQHAVHCLGSSSTQLNGTLTVNSTHGSSCAFYVGDTARLSAGSMALSAANGASVQDSGAAVCTGAFSLTNVSGVGLGISGAGASMVCKDVVVISNNGSSTVFVEKGARVSFVSTTATKTLNNNLLSGAPVGIRCLSGGQFESPTSVITNFGTANAYGCDVRGGGRAFFGVQPVGVSAGLGDFIVGTNPGDIYPDTALSAAFSSISAGGSLVQRST